MSNDREHPAAFRSRPKPNPPQSRSAAGTGRKCSPRRRPSTRTSPPVCGKPRPKAWRRQNASKRYAIRQRPCGRGAGRTSPKHATPGKEAE